MIVLAWICSPARSFKTFVSTRIGEIQSNSYPLQWKHIPGEVNVADDISRGILVQDLTQRWKSGPDFLSDPEEQWPETISAAVEEKEVNTENHKTPVVCTISTTKEAICCTNFSSWLYEFFKLAKTNKSNSSNTETQSESTKQARRK